MYTTSVVTEEYDLTLEHLCALLMIGSVDTAHPFDSIREAAYPYLDDKKWKAFAVYNNFNNIKIYM